MTADLDSQHRAVQGAAEELRMNRYWNRRGQMQLDYLHDLEELAIEVLLAMREAGINQESLVETARSIDKDPVRRTIADLSEDNLELLLREAFESRRQLVQAT